LEKDLQIYASNYGQYYSYKVLALPKISFLIKSNSYMATFILHKKPSGHFNYWYHRCYWQLF